MHHADTNVEGDDPDITGNVVRFHPNPSTLNFDPNL